MRTFALVVVTSAAFDGLCVDGSKLDAFRFNLTKLEQDDYKKAEEVTQEEACEKELKGTWTGGWLSWFSWFSEDECDCPCCVPENLKDDAEVKLHSDSLDNEVKFNDLTRHAAMALDANLEEKLKEFFPDELGSNEAQRTICTSLKGAFDSNFFNDYCQVSSDMLEKLDEEKLKLSEDTLVCAYTDDDMYKEKGIQFGHQREECESPNGEKTGYQFFEPTFLWITHCGCSCCKANEQEDGMDATVGGSVTTTVATSSV